MMTRLVALALLALLLTFGPAHAQTPIASPQASPVAAMAGCAGLANWFLALATAIEGNEGLAIMERAAYDPLALSDEDATTAVTTLDALIATVEALTPPEPAVAYHRAYLDLLAWYRDLAANTDALAHQQIINNDRALFGKLGQAVYAGQLACGFDVWNTAWESAFP